MTNDDPPPDPFGVTSFEPSGGPRGPREPQDVPAPSTARGVVDPAPETFVHNLHKRAAPPESLATGDALIGRILKQRYKLKRLVGEGGMGGVYEAEHLEIGKRVAIKLVHTIHARDPHVAARIKQEARSTGAIESENIVQVFDAGEDEDLGLFLVMELLKGEDLSTLLGRKGRISAIGAAAIAIQAAQGLARAHAAGIVHRDLKPANVFLCTRDDGSTLVKLVDFGIAKLLRDADRAQQAPGLTRLGMVLGTPQYMSPEQAQGLPSVDHRTDIYSLGSVLFEMVVGSSPFAELPTYEQTILQIMTSPTPRMSDLLPEVHPGLDQLCASMMARDPNARPADMSLVREHLTRLLPEISGGVVPVTAEPGPLGVGDGRSSARMLAARAIGAPSSGHARAARPATHSTMAVNAGDRLFTPQAEPPESLGLPPRRDRGTAVLVGVSAAALMALAGGIAVVRMTTSRATPAPAGVQTAAGASATAAPVYSGDTPPPPVVDDKPAPSAAALPIDPPRPPPVEETTAPDAAPAHVAVTANPPPHRSRSHAPKTDSSGSADKATTKPEERSLGTITAPETWDGPETTTKPKH